MNDFVFSILALSIAFLLVTQLWIVMQVRFLVSSIAQPTATFSPVTSEEAHQRSVGEFEQMVDNTYQHINIRVPSGLDGTLMVGNIPTEVSLKDLSETGALLCTGEKAELKVGGSYGLKFALPNGKTIETRFRIMRNTLEKGAYGGCFDGLQLRMRSVLRDYITSEARKELEAEVSKT